MVSCELTDRGLQNGPGVLDRAHDDLPSVPVRHQTPAATGSLSRLLLTGIVVAFLGTFLVLPLIVVFVEAFRHGVTVYLAALTDRDALAAIRLTLFVAVAAITINTAFGLAAAWCLGKFRFPGRQLIIALIDLPISVSPVVVGLLLVLVYGRHGWLGSFLEGHGLRIIFATPGIVLATAFVTLPLVVRELIPTMDAQGREQEEAARLLGANGWQVFLYVTLPSIRWALLYGVILCTARAVGEFGAVSVVSGHIRGLTTTVPLHVEILYNEYRFSSAFAVASLLTIVGVVSLAGKTLLERMARHRQMGIQHKAL